MGLDAFGIEREHIAKYGLVPGPGSQKRILEGKNALGDAVPPIRAARNKTRAQWSKARAESDSTGPMVIGSSLDDVSKGMPDVSEVHSNSPVYTGAHHTQRRRERRLRKLDTKAEPIGKSLTNGDIAREVLAAPQPRLIGRKRHAEERARARRVLADPKRARAVDDYWLRSDPVRKAMGTPTTNRGAASPTFKPPAVPPAAPDVKAIRGKLAPLKSAMVAATKVK